MTLDELARTLPFGLHDAEVSSLSIDYLRRELRLRLMVWVSDSDDPDAELYREAELTLSGLVYCVIEPPYPAEAFQKAGPLTIDTGTVESLQATPSTALPDPKSEGAFLNWIFVREWNSFLYVAATAATLLWTDGQEAPNSG